MTARGMHRTWFRRIRHVPASPSSTSARSHGQLLAHADADVERAITVIMPLPLSLGVVVLIGLSIVSLALIDPALMLVGLALFPSLAILNHLYSRRVEAPASRTQARLGEVSSVAHESFEGALLVKTLGLEAREVERLSVVARELRTARLAVGRLRATFEPVLDALPNLGTIALLALAWRVADGVITTGQLVQAMALFTILTFPCAPGFLLEELPGRSSRPTGSPMSSPRRRARRRPRSRNPAAGRAPGGRRAGAELRLPADAEPVLAGVDLALAPTEVVALVGATGSGKSTLCHSPTCTSRPPVWWLGGVDLSTAEPASLRSAVALVFQEAFLFAATVRENLALGWDATDEDCSGRSRPPARGASSSGCRSASTSSSASGASRSRRPAPATLARALLRRPGLLISTTPPRR